MWPPNPYAQLDPYYGYTSYGYGQPQQPQQQSFPQMPVPPGMGLWQEAAHTGGAFDGLTDMQQLKVGGQANQILDDIMGPRSFGTKFADSARDLWSTNMGKAGLGLNVAGGIAQVAMGEDPAQAVGSTAGGVAGSVLGNMVLPGVGGWIGSAVGSAAGSALGGLFGGDDEEEAEKERKKQERMARMQGLSQNMNALGQWYADDAARRHAAIVNAFS